MPTDGGGDGGCGGPNTRVGLRSAFVGFAAGCSIAVAFFHLRARRKWEEQQHQRCCDNASSPSNSPNTLQNGGGGGGGDTPQNFAALNAANQQHFAHRDRRALVDSELHDLVDSGAFQFHLTNPVPRPVDLHSYVQPASIDLPVTGSAFLVKEKVGR